MESELFQNLLEKVELLADKGEFNIASSTILIELGTLKDNKERATMRSLAASWILICENFLEAEVQYKLAIIDNPFNLSIRNSYSRGLIYYKEDYAGAVLNLHLAKSLNRMIGEPFDWHQHYLLLGVCYCLLGNELGDRYISKAFDLQLLSQLPQIDFSGLEWLSRKHVFLNDDIREALYNNLRQFNNVDWNLINGLFEKLDLRDK